MRKKGQFGSTNLKIQSKAKYNKEKCYRCKYHSEATCGYLVKIMNNDGSYRMATVCCDYLTITGKSCLVDVADKNGYKKTIDRRGDDRNNCKLFEEGKISFIEKTKNYHHHHVILPNNS